MGTLKRSSHLGRKLLKRGSGNLERGFPPKRAYTQKLPPRLEPMLRFFWDVFSCGSPAKPTLPPWPLVSDFSAAWHGANEDGLWVQSVFSNIR